MKKSKEIAKQFQKGLDFRNKKYKQLGIVKTTIQDAFDRFLAINSNKNPTTIKEYKWFYEKFQSHFNPSKPATSITKTTCEDWLISLRKTKYSQNTLCGFNKTLKKFLRLLFEYSYVPVFILNKDVTFKAQVKDVNIFSETDLMTFMEGLASKNSNFRTTFSMLLFTGLRPTDIYKIKAEDIDLENKKMKYYSQKTDEYKEVPLHEDLISILRVRINEVKSGNLIHYSDVHNIGRAYREYIKEIGLRNKGYTLRTFRKTFVSLAHESGIDLATVSKLAGHSQITTTERYYNRLGMTKKTDELNKLRVPKRKVTEVQTEVQFPLSYII
ncbi:hypothetical protein ASZ90_004903 [hydrocarbon metagenome]|uniref:Integrase n=1 Tax=hydrocarbon metagenome TaxID=938273 RepID=A0A0W8FWI7_9ZZZZ